MPVGVIIAACLVFAAVLALFTGVGQIIASKDTVADRLDAFTPAPSSQGTGGQTQSRKSGRLTGLLNRLISRQAFGESIAATLARANLPLTVTEYVALTIVCIAIAFMLAFALSGQLLLGLLGGIASSFLPGLYVRRKQRQRQVAFQGQLTDVLTLLVGSLRSGYGLTIAMDTVAKQMPVPASEEFGRVVREIGLGASTTQALENLVRRIRSDDLDLMVTAISVQYEVGGNLATILDTISDTIRERVRIKAQLRALTVQHTMTRYILTALPLILGGIMYIINPEYMGALFQPGWTLAIPFGAGIMLIVGYVVMGKLSTIEV
ncbi:MAG TPA: type II secretion system F family protein [Anaerolineae bacterium]|nr:type II secretion system F family protein [Anaerolineae bacterium]